MQCTISAREPNILREAKSGDLFLVHTPQFCECVCTTRARETDDLSAHCRIVVVGCRVHATDARHWSTGATLTLHQDTPITFLEQVEPAAFRERGTRDEFDATLDYLEKHRTHLGGKKIRIPTGRVVYRRGEQVYERAGKDASLDWLERHEPRKSRINGEPSVPPAERAATTGEVSASDLEKTFSDLEKTFVEFIEHITAGAERVIAATFRAEPAGARTATAASDPPSRL